MGPEKQTAGSGKKTLIQAIKFILVSCIASVIQLVLVNVLYFGMRGWTAPLPGMLSVIFTEQTMGIGHANWGYVLPFFISNLVANIAAYAINKKRTFKSDAPKKSFIIRGRRRKAKSSLVKTQATGRGGGLFL